MCMEGWCFIQLLHLMILFAKLLDKISYKPINGTLKIITWENRHSCNPCLSSCSRLGPTPDDVLSEEYPLISEGTNELTPKSQSCCQRDYQLICLTLAWFLLENRGKDFSWLLFSMYTEWCFFSCVVLFCFVFFSYRLIITPSSKLEAKYVSVFLIQLEEKTSFWPASMAMILSKSYYKF